MIDADMQFVLPIKYPAILDFHEGLARVKNEEGYLGYFHQKQREFVTCFDYQTASNFVGGRALVRDKSDSKYFIDTDGKQVPFEDLTESEKKFL